MLLKKKKACLKQKEYLRKVNPSLRGMYRPVSPVAIFQAKVIDGGGRLLTTFGMTEEGL